MQTEKTLIQKTIEQEKSKRNTYIIIGVVLFVFILGLGGFLLFSNSAPSPVINPETGSQFPDINTGSSTLETYTTTSTSLTGSDDLDYLNGTTTPTLTHIWPKAVAGYALSYSKIEIPHENSTTSDQIINSKVETVVVKKYKEQTTVYFVDKATGNIYFASSPLFNPIRLSNETVLGVMGATFSSSTDYVFIRSKLNDGQIISSIYKIPRVENSSLYKVSDIEGRVLFVSNYANNSFVYSKQEVLGSGVYLYDMKNNIENKIIGLPIKNYTLKYVVDGNILLQTKPLYLTNQETFLIDIKTKKISLLSKSNINNIYDQNLVQIVYLKNTKTSYINGNVFYTISKTTLPDKCVFYKINSLLCAIPNKSYGVLLPDDWYKGKAHFTDSLYIISADKKTESEVYRLSSSEVENIDLQHPLIDKGGLYTGFLNKNDASLWIIDNTKLESYE